MSPNVTEAFQGLADRTGVAFNVRLLFRQPHHEESGDDGEKAKAIDEKARWDTDRRHEQAGDRRTDDTGAVESGAVEGDGVHQILAAGHLNHERLPGRHIESHRDSAQDGKHDDVPGLDQLAPGERSYGKRKDHGAGVGDHDHVTFRVTIGHPSAPRGEEKHRRRCRRGDETEQGFRAGELINEPALRRGRHPRAGKRDELAGKKEPEIPMPERGECFSK